LAEWLRRSPAK